MITVICLYISSSETVCHANATPHPKLKRWSLTEDLFIQFFVDVCCLFSRHAAWIRHLQPSSIKVQIFSKFWWKWKNRDYSNCHELKGALTWAGLQRTSRKFPADPQLPWVPAKQNYSNCHKFKGALTWAGLQRTSRRFPADPQLPWVPAKQNYSNCHEFKGALTWAGLQRTSRRFPADPQLPWVPAEQWNWCFATWMTHRSSLLSMRIGPRGCGGAPAWRLMQRITTPLTQCCGEEDKHCFNLKVDAENYNTFNTMLWTRRTLTQRIRTPLSQCCGEEDKHCFTSRYLVDYKQKYSRMWLLWWRKSFVWSRIWSEILLKLFTAFPSIKPKRNDLSSVFEQYCLSNINRLESNDVY